MRTDHLLGLTAHGFHKIFFTDWGDPANERVVICVHGLTRNCRDFDFLAQALESEFRVVCPDVAGRGRSNWLYNKDDYSYPQYMADMNALIARVSAAPAAAGWIGKLADSLTKQHGERSLYWVGTSMGGMLGMLLASRPNTPIRKLIVNDVGPLIPKASLERIGTSFEGVEKAFAVQAGRELRVFVTPTLINDEQAFNLARQIVRKIEDELQYPGQIRVTVVRETRCVEFAK